MPNFWLYVCLVNLGLWQVYTAVISIVNNVTNEQIGVCLELQCANILFVRNFYIVSLIAHCYSRMGFLRDNIDRITRKFTEVGAGDSNSNTYQGEWNRMSIVNKDKLNNNKEKSKENMNVVNVNDSDTIDNNDANNEDDDLGQKKNILFYKNFSYIKLFIIPLFILFLIISIFAMIPYMRISMIIGTVYHYPLTITSKDNEWFNTYIPGSLSIESIIGGCLIQIFLLFPLMLMTFIIRQVYLIPLKNDKFLFKVELFSIFLILFITQSGIGGIMLISSITIQKGNIVIIDSLAILLFLLLFIILSLIRHNRYKDFTIKFYLSDFNSFMNRDITFLLLKSYLSIHNEEHYKFLSFWIDYFIFKDLAKEYEGKLYQWNTTIRNRKESDAEDYSMAHNQKDAYVEALDEKLRTMAGLIFNYYCYVNSMDMSKSKSSLTINNNSSNNIDFPIDIYEKIDEMHKKNFEGDHLGKVYDEAFIWIRCQLEKDYEELKLNKREIVKLERTVFFFECHNCLPSMPDNNKNLSSTALNTISL